MVHYPYQSFIESVIKTAESMGHTGWAKLSRSHPAIQKNHWSQIRGNSNVLASYVDELGNQIQLLAFGVANPFVRQTDPRQLFYGRLRGTSTGHAIKANSRNDALKILAARECVAVNSSNLIVASKPALGVSYNHN